MTFKSLTMKECNFAILLTRKENENGTWWLQDLRFVFEL